MNSSGETIGPGGVREVLERSVPSLTSERGGKRSVT